MLMKEKEKERKTEKKNYGEKMKQQEKKPHKDALGMKEAGAYGLEVLEGMGFQARNKTQPCAVPKTVPKEG